MPEDKVFKPSMLGLVPRLLALTILLIFFGFQFFFIPALAFGLTFVIVIFAVVYLVVIVAVYIFSYLSIKMTSYELRPDGLMIKRGVIAKKQILLLYSQIQDVTEYQDLFSKLLGLKALQIETMTSSSALAGRLANLTEKDADTMQQSLLQIVNSRSKKAAQKTVSNAAVSAKTTAKISAKTRIDVNAGTSYDIGKEQDEKAANPYPIYAYKMGLVSLLICIIVICLVVAFVIYIRLPLESSLNLAIYAIFIMIIPLSYFIRQLTFQYWIGASTVTIKTGLFSTQKTSMEYEKIQDYIFYRGIIDRILGLANIRLETGSVVMPQGDNNKQQPNYGITSLKLEDAKAISATLMKKVGIKYVPLAKPLVQDIPLSRKKIIKRSLAGIIGLIVVFGILLAGFWIYALFTQEISQSLFSTVLLWAAIIFVILAIWTVIYQKMYYDRYYYDWSRNTLTIRKGAIGDRQIYLQYSRIQNVFVDQDLFDRLFGLYDVHVSTVGQGSILLCHIDGLTRENADRMKAVLLKLVKENS